VVPANPVLQPPVLLEEFVFRLKLVLAFQCTEQATHNPAERKISTLGIASPEGRELATAMTDGSYKPVAALFDCPVLRRIHGVDLSVNLPNTQTNARRGEHNAGEMELRMQLRLMPQLDRSETGCRCPIAKQLSGIQGEY
jgi:hypothetical protein